MRRARVSLLVWSVCLAIGVAVTRAEELYAEEPCARSVSLAPSVTETLFELGLGERVVGVTRFCRVPKQVEQIPKVGGFLDVSMERVLLRKPSRVFALQESGATSDTLRRLGIHVVELDHRTVSGIKQSLSTIGAECGVEGAAEERLAELRRREAEIARACARSKSDPAQRVMVVVGRTREGHASSGVYISGKDGFYSDVLRLVGAVNVNTQSTVAVPSV